MAKFSMDINAVNKASEQSSGSGDELVRLVEELIDGVEDLTATFKGNGAVAYQNFMAESKRVQDDLIQALGGISQGQAESAKQYVEMDDTMASDGKSAESTAQGVKGTGFGPR